MCVKGGNTHCILFWFASRVVEATHAILVLENPYFEVAWVARPHMYEACIHCNFQRYCLWSWIHNTLVLCFLCVVYASVLHCGHRFAGITMGEVFFAAVLHWVTRVDDFTKLLVDTCGWVVWQVSEVQIDQKIPIKADCCNFMDCTLMQTSLTLLCKQSATYMALLLMK